MTKLDLELPRSLESWTSLINSSVPEVFKERRERMERETQRDGDTDMTAELFVKT